MYVLWCINKITQKLHRPQFIAPAIYLCNLSLALGDHVSYSACSKSECKCNWQPDNKIGHLNYTACGLNLRNDNSWRPTELLYSERFPIIFMFIQIPTSWKGEECKENLCIGWLVNNVSKLLPHVRVCELLEVMLKTVKSKDCCQSGGSTFVTLYRVARN